MEKEIISAILGSAVIGSLVSSLFSHLTNRKNSTLQHITEERKIWREKIRKISEDLEEARFKDKKINRLLVQLEVNINSYGKVAKDDYEKDSHIWREIEELKRIDKEEEFNIHNKREFELHKELLIYYLSLMLKEDWERSKQEVKGYSSILIEVIIIAVVNCIMAVCYSYKIYNKVKDLTDILMNTIIITLIIYSVFRYFLGLGVSKMVDNNRIKKGYLRKLIISFLLFAIIVGLIPALMFEFLNAIYPKLIWLNFVLWVICVGEFIFIYLNWIDVILKKAWLVRTVIGVRQKFLGEKQLEQYENDIKEMYNYIVANDRNSEEIKSARKFFKRLKSEYKMELNNRKMMLKKERTNLKKVQEYNRIQEKIKEINELADRVNKIYKKVINS